MGDDVAHIEEYDPATAVRVAFFGLFLLLFVFLVPYWVDDSRVPVVTQVAAKINSPPVNKYCAGTTVQASVVVRPNLSCINV